jgi:hypothetical protein
MILRFAPELHFVIDTGGGMMPMPGPAGRLHLRAAAGAFLAGKDGRPCGMLAAPKR